MVERAIERVEAAYLAAIGRGEPDPVVVVIETDHEQGQAAVDVVDRLQEVGNLSARWPHVARALMAGDRDESKISVVCYTRDDEPWILDVPRPEGVEA
jgi:hypothetical protein